MYTCIHVYIYSGDSAGARRTVHCNPVYIDRRICVYICMYVQVLLAYCAYNFFTSATWAAVDVFSSESFPTSARSTAVKPAQY